MKLEATVVDGRWVPAWQGQHCAVPISMREVEVLSAIVDEWIRLKDAGSDLIESLPGHAPGDVEAVLLKVGALMRSKPPRVP